MLETPRRNKEKELSFYKTLPEDKKKKSIFKNFYVTVFVGFGLSILFSYIYYDVYYINDYKNYEIVALIGLIAFIAAVITKAIKDLEGDTVVSTISKVSLVDEYENNLGEWYVAGKSSLIIGKSTKSRKVDIDLKETKEEYLVSKNHAVMNYAAGNWYIEDLGSAYGVGIKKANGTFRRRLKIDTPYKLEKGDIVYINKIRLKLT